MQQLSGLDNAFLAMQDKRQHMHIAALGIYDPSSAPEGNVRFKDVLEFFSGKINEIPFFRQRLVKPPLSMDRPYFVQDASVDVEYHVRHIALPHPGDWRQFMIQIARLHSRPLDMARPLWEAYVIGGLDNIEGIAEGSFAIYIKLHHCGIDGQAGAKLIAMLHSLTPEIESADKTRVVYADREPTALELTARSVINRSAQFVDASRVAAQLGKKTLEKSKNLNQFFAKLQKSLAGSDEEEKRDSSTPGDQRCRFNGKVSPHRVVDAVGISLEDIMAIRKNIDATVNDIFMSVTSGALRHYLKDHHDLPESGLNASVPMAFNPAGHSSANNIGMAVIPIHTDIEDPIERLLAIKRSANRVKQEQDDLGRDFTARVLDFIPVKLALMAQNATVLSKCSVTISNVRGPDMPLYIAGARLQMFMPVNMPLDGVGISCTGFSYNGTLWVSITACREMVPDPGFLVQCFRESVDELLKASAEYGAKRDMQTGSAPVVTNSSGKKAAAKKAPAKKAAAKKAPAKKAAAKKAPAKKAVSKKTTQN